MRLISHVPSPILHSAAADGHAVRVEPDEEDAPRRPQLARARLRHLRSVEDDARVDLRDLGAHGLDERASGVLVKGHRPECER